MLKKRKSELKCNYPVHLYRDDLLEIETILKKHFSSKKIEIGFDDYTADSISEIPEDTKATDNIDIMVMDHFYMAININSFWSEANIHIGEPDVENLGIAYQILEIFQERSKKNSVLFSKVIKYAGYVLIFLFTITTILLYSDQKNGTTQFSTNELDKYSLLLILPIFLLAANIFLILFPIKSTVEFKEKNKSNNFWMRNKDALLTSIIVALFSFLLGLFLR